MEDVNRFLEYLEYQRHYSDCTVDSYRKDLEAYFSYLEQEGLSYLKITYSDVRLYLMYLKDNQQDKASTISRHLSSLRSFYRYLCAEQKVESNVFLLVTSPKQEQRLPRYFEYNELEALLAVPDITTPIGQRDRLILEILYATGIRVGELVKIKREDINQYHQQILIHGKGSKERIVNYGEYAADSLSLYLKDGYQQLNKFNSSYLFLNNQGRVITTRGVAYILDKLIKQTSIHKNISPHMIRHTFATHLLNEGCDILSVKELLGHESLSSTQIYTHVTTEHLKEVYHHNFPRSVLHSKEKNK